MRDLHHATTAPLATLIRELGEARSALEAKYGEAFEGDFESGLVWDDDYALWNRFAECHNRLVARRMLEARGRKAAS